MTQYLHTAKRTHLLWAMIDNLLFPQAAYNFFKVFFVFTFSQVLISTLQHLVRNCLHQVYFIISTSPQPNCVIIKILRGITYLLPKYRSPDMDIYL